MHNTSWARGLLGDYAYIKARIGWRGLSASEYTQDGPYLIAGNHIQNGSINWTSCDHLSIHRYQESLEIALREGDIILTKDGTIGRLAIITDLPGLATINGTMMLVRVRIPLQPRYVYHYLTGETFQRLVADKVSGSSIPHIFQRDMIHLPILIPSEQEQKRISSILDAIDTQIQHTEQLITKLKAQKAGLLQDLLTSGLDEHWQLRDPITHPEQFKDSAVGRIPQEWEMKQLKTLVSSPITDFGSFSMTNLLDFRTSGVPFLRTEAIQDDGIDKSQITFISEKVHKQLPQSVVHAGDVLFTKIGASLGRVCVYDGSLGECNSNAASAKLRLDTSRVNQHFVAYYLRSNIAKRQYLKEVISIPPRINLGQINNWYIPIPTLSEQNYIAATLDAIDTDIRAEEVYCNKLKLYKKGLMQDLLMGRIRMNAEEMMTSGVGFSRKED